MGMNVPGRTRTRFSVAFPALPDLRPVRAARPAQRSQTRRLPSGGYHVPFVFHQSYFLVCSFKPHPA